MFVGDRRCFCACLGSRGRAAQGATAFGAGSHTRGHLGGAQPALFDTEDVSGAVYPLLQPGDALCINPFIIHGSASNVSKTHWRRSFIVGFAIPRAIVHTNDNKDVGMSWMKDRYIQTPAEDAVAVATCGASIDTIVVPTR